MYIHSSSQANQKAETERICQCAYTAQWVRSHCAVGAQILRSGCAQLRRGAQPMRSGCAAIAQWLRTITVFLRNVMPCVRSHCAVVAQPLRSGCAVIEQLVCRHCAVGAQHYAVLLRRVTQWVHSYYAVKHVCIMAAYFSLCSHYAAITHKATC